jgi:hypothetical protein
VSVLCNLLHSSQWQIELTLLTPRGAAFAPLAFAVGRFTYAPGMLVLVGMWALSFYNAMLLVRERSRR